MIIKLNSPKAEFFYHIYLHTLNGIKIEVDNKDNLKKSDHLTFTLLSKLYCIKRKQNWNYKDHLIKMKTYRN